MMWCHIFVTFRHIPGSMWRCQVSKKVFLVLPKMWRFSWNLVQMRRFRHIVTSFFWVRLGTKQSFKTWPGFWVPGFSIPAWNDPQPLGRMKTYLSWLELRGPKKIWLKICKNKNNSTDLAPFRKPDMRPVSVMSDYLVKLVIAFSRHLKTGCHFPVCITPVAGLIFDTKNRAIFLESFCRERNFGRSITCLQLCFQ